MKFDPEDGSISKESPTPEPEKQVIKVLDKGFVRLEETMGSDLSIVNAAKVSFDKRADSFGTAEHGVLNFLMKANHGSPFEQGIMRFHIKAPKFVVAEHQRHRISSWNEVSGRYVDFGKRDFYIPDHLRVQKGKPGRYYFERMDDDATHQEFVKWLAFMSEQFKANYAYFADLDVAKEMCRMPIPFNFYTEYIYTANLRSLMNFLTLRLSPTAMFEIRQYAKVIAQFFAQKFPASWEAFKKYSLKDVMDKKEFEELL